MTIKIINPAKNPNKARPARCPWFIDEVGVVVNEQTK
jgi:hypothetical protein